MSIEAFVIIVDNDSGDSGGHATFDLCLGVFNGKEHRESIRKQLADGFNNIWDNVSIQVKFSDEPYS